ncbi:NTP transferase domain-containing protein [Candidatus Woesearchaeota archaeon]|nr:NTP transferase domain-containing protein [Candidatus Woesearchaeota archaeon]
MKAVLLAAGIGKRCYPLTLTRPKPLLRLANTTILEHNLKEFADLFDELIIIIGYKGDMIRKLLGDKIHGTKIKYVEQLEQLGTGHAVLQAKEHVKGSFVVCGADDLFFRQDVKDLLKNKGSAVMCHDMEWPESFGVIVEEKGVLKQIVEKPEKFISHQVNTGMYLLQESIFPILESTEKSMRGEFEITDAINQLAAKEQVKVTRADKWLPIGYPWHLLDANKLLLEGMKEDISGKVEKNVTIKGMVKIGKGTVIKAGSYIEGPAIIGENCELGPNCYIRPFTAIGNKCRIGLSEVKNSILMDNVTSKHFAYIGESIIAEGVNIGAGTVIADLRHDNTNVQSFYDEKLVDTNRRKFGAVIADNVKLAIHTSIYPGRKIWPGKFTRPGDIVKSDLL